VQKLVLIFSHAVQSSQYIDYSIAYITIRQLYISYIDKWDCMYG